MPNLTIILPLLFLAGLVVVTVVPPRYLDNRYLAMFRSLFPSWRFFDEVTETPVLLVRTGLSGDTLGPWKVALRSPTNPSWALFLNPNGNRMLAHHMTVERLVADVSARPIEEQNVAEWVSYRLVERLALKAARANRGQSLAQEEQVFQFKVVLLSPWPGDESSQDTIISPAQRIEPTPA